MAVLIDNRQTRHKLHLDKIRQTAQDILNALDCPDAELSILLVNDPQIEILNTKYFNRRKPTNVIAFPMQEGKFSNISPSLLGDVAVSIDTAVKEGKKAGIGMEKRLTELLVHGILHLLGYDHENNEQEAEEMERKSETLLKQFKSTAVHTSPH